MAKSGAERQRALRGRRRAERIGADVPDAERSEGEHRMDVWIRISAYLCLERYAEHHGISQRSALERILMAAGEAVPCLDPLPGNSCAFVTR
jgi:hypothetical protein